ncbi:MAG: autotransporter outer membrane beta-barrel domain-containing protein [Pseudomonadota bacterium]
MRVKGAFKTIVIYLIFLAPHYCALADAGENLPNEQDYASTIEDKKEAQTIEQGVFTKVIRASAKQKSLGEFADHKIDTECYGLGYRARIDDTTFSIAAFASRSKIVTHNKYKAEGYMGVMDGHLDVTPSIFVDGRLIFGQGHVKAPNIQKIRGEIISYTKPKAKIFGANVFVGQDYLARANLHLIPYIGLVSDSIFIKSYRKISHIPARTYRNRGSAIVNTPKYIPSLNVQQTSSVLGITVKHLRNIEDAELTSEVHGSFARNHGKNQELTSFYRSSFAVSYLNPRASTYNAGGSMKFYKPGYELGIGYDASFAKKFVAQVYCLKVGLKL